MNPANLAWSGGNRNSQGSNSERPCKWATVSTLVGAGTSAKVNADVPTNPPLGAPLDDEKRPADGSGEFGLLPGELELRFQFGGNVHAVGKLETHLGNFDKIDNVRQDPLLDLMR
jgi:hypothetical protein